MARLLFLGASVSQRPAIAFARSCGHFVVACDGDPSASAFPLCDVAAVVDFSDVDEVAAVAEREGVDGVLAICTDRAVVPASLVAQRLGLPGIPPDVADAMTHKGTMRRRLEAAGVPQPGFRIVNGDPDPADLRGVSLPAVLKPADSGGQRGLARITRLENLAQHLPYTLAASRTGEALLEQFVEGVEVNTLFVVRGGTPTLLTISDRLRPSGAGFGVGWIHLYPSSLSQPIQLEIERVASRAIRALGMTDGIAFPQLIAGDSGVVVVEVAARIAAGQMADLVRHATGIELYRVAIQQALGLPVPDAWVTPSAKRPVAIRFFTARPGVLPVGVVRTVSGLDDVRSAPGVLDAGLYFGPGTDIGPLRVDADRRGYVIATGESPRDALARADSAARKLRVEVVGRRSRLRVRRAVAAPVLVALLVAATAGAFVLTERAKLQRPLIRGTIVDKTFSPLCHCRRDIAHIAFRLVRRTEVGVTIMSGAGAKVARLLKPRMLGPRIIRLTWDGREANGEIAGSGRYFPDVQFPTLRRSLELPSAIALDDVPPVVERAVMRRRGRHLVVRYRFSEPAQAALLVGGHRVVLTRFAPLAGTVRWGGRSHGLVQLVAIDRAGNRSRARSLGLLP